MIHNRTVRRLAGIDKILDLARALTTAPQPQARLGTLAIAGAVLISALPMLSFYTEPGLDRVDFKTLLVGIAASFAILFRRRLGIHLGSVTQWRRSLHLTHVAFALGCIPTLLVIALYPEALYHLQPSQSGTASAGGPPPALSSILLHLAGIAAWAALTEEFIFRGLLIGVFRRWNALPSGRTRDTIAVLASAAMFGLAHLPSWGPAMSFALFGLGIGFGLAYIAIGEVLLPLIVYHLIFDFLSLSFAVFLRNH